MIGILLLIGLLVLASVLLTIAIGGYCDLAEENRRLRRENAKLRHPSARIAPGEHPIFDVTLAEIRALDEVPSDGAA